MAKNKALLIFLTPHQDLKSTSELIANIPEIGLIIPTEELYIATEEKSNIQVWRQLNQTIFDNYDDYAGFVIVCQPDDMIYTAMATDLALENNHKPIAFTTAPFSESGFDIDQQITQLGLRTNIINSLQIVNTGMSAVVIVYGQKVITAAKARKVNISQLNAFESLDNSYVAEFDLGLKIKRQPRRKHKRLKLNNSFSSSVAVLYLHPGLEWSIYKSILQQADVLLIKSGRQTGMTADEVKQLGDNFKHKPVIIYNRLGLLNKYASQLPNCLFVDNHTWETTLVRAMWVNAQVADKSKFLKAFQQL